MAHIDYTLTGANRDLVLNRDLELCGAGRAGTGKTVAGCLKLHLAALTVPGLKGLILRATGVSLAATTLQTFQRHVAHQAIKDGTVRWYGGSPSEPAGFIYTNGSRILAAGADRPTKFLSLEVDRILVDEAVEITLDVHETLISRLRGNAPTYKQILLLTNPSHPAHWIKRRADNGTLTLITSTHRDNPAYTNPDGTPTPAGHAYATRLDALTGTRRARLRDGLWVGAEGLIYDTWDETIHIVPRTPIPHHWRRIWSIDFGYTNPTVVQRWAIDPDGRLVLYSERVATHEIVEDTARAILKEVTDHNGDWTEPKPEAIICDHDAENRAQLERVLQRGTVPAHKKVTEGIEAVQARLKIAGDGKPRLTIQKGALTNTDHQMQNAGLPTGTHQEILTYTWAPPTLGEAPKEEPNKQNDHSMDALRYAVAHLDRTPRPNIRWI